MNIRPVASPHQIGADIKTTNASEARNRAIAALSATQAPQQPPQQVVQNQNAISPEEMTAVQAPSVKEEESEELNTSTNTESSQVVTEAQPPKEEIKQVEDPALTKQFTQLARQEKALRLKQQQQEQVFKQKEAELKAREEAAKAIEAKYTQGFISKEELAKNPLKYLTEAGTSYDQLTEQVLNAGALDPRVEAHISKLEAKIQQLEKATEESAKAQQDKQAKDYEQAKQQVSRGIDKLIATDSGGKYELIKSTGSQKDVLDLIVRTFEEDGSMLTNEEAADLVEQQLEEEIMKVSRIGKIQSKLQASTLTAKAKETEQKPTPKTQQTQNAPQMKTLTNTVSASRPLTPRERAIAVMKGQKI